MDLKTVLDASLSADPGIRQNAESKLHSISNEQQKIDEDVLFECLSVAIDSSAQTGTRRAAVVFFKNLITRQYSQMTTMSDSNRTILRQRLFQGIAESSDGATTQVLCTIVGEMIRCDYPTRWNDLEDTIEQLLNSTDQMAMVFCGILVLLELVKQHKSSGIIHKFLPKLLIMAEMLQSSDMVMAGEMLWKIFKVYKVSINTDQLDDYFTDRQSLTSWMHIFLRAVSGERAAPKSRKWSMRIINILFIDNTASFEDTEGAMMRVGSNSSADEFATYFNADFVPEICRVYLEQAKRDWNWTTHERCCLMRFFMVCLALPQAAVQIVNNFDTIFKLIQYSLTTTANELELFNHDEVMEFVNEQYPYDDDLWSIQAICGNFISELVKSKQEALPLVLRYLNEMTSHDATTLNKDCALRIMIREPQIHSAMNVNEFISSRGLTMLSASHEEPLVVARFSEFVCSLYPGIIDTSLAHQIYTIVSDNINSPVLMVQIRSIKALRSLLIYDSIRKLHEPKIKQTVDKLLVLCNSISSEVFFEGILEELFEMYKKELVPHTLDLFARLQTQFIKLAHEASAGDGEGIDILQGTLSMMSSAVCSLDRDVTVHEQAMALAAPVLQLALTKTALDCVPEALDVINSSIQAAKSVLPPLWSVFETICSAYESCDNEISYMDDLLPTLAHYANYGAETFNTSPNYCKSLTNIITNELASSKNEIVMNQVSACALAIVMLFKFKLGVLDDLLLPMVQGCIAGGNQATLKGEMHLASYYSDMLVALIYYNPVNVLNILQPHMSAYLKQWINNKSNRPCSGKIKVLALLKILTYSQAINLVYSQLSILVENSLLKYLDQSKGTGSYNGGDDMFVNQAFGFSNGGEDSLYFVDDSDLTDMQETLDTVNEEWAYSQAMKWLSTSNSDLLHNHIERLMSSEQFAAHQKLCTL